ncbi:MAG: hypothetical protein FJ189_12070, partial [Gammaproteobacteria bacterium]|nr:hypothetical protein [Gammaproteobacteria bacterium]
MALVEQIDRAIGAHGMWKARIRMAIDTGKSEFDPAIVKTDNSCDFGKWLYGTLEVKSSPFFEKVKGLHAEFHAEAARILQLALSGQKVVAQAALENPAGKFVTLSSSLTKLMM